MRGLVALLSMGCAEEELSVSGGELSPPPVQPVVTVSEAISGRIMWMEVAQGTPGWTSILWRGTPGQSCPPYLQGQCMDMVRPRITRVAQLDADGRSTTSVMVPAGLPLGGGTRLQAAIHNNIDVILTPATDPQIGAGTVCAGNPSAVANPGFEETATGTWSLPAGWVWAVDASEGSAAVAFTGNVYMEQWFPAVSVRSLTQASFDSWHDGLDAPLMRVDWTWSDGTSDGHTFLSAELDGWQTHDLLPLLDPSKKLVHLRVWGYSSLVPGADEARFDHFALCR